MYCFHVTAMTCVLMRDTYRLSLPHGVLNVRLNVSSMYSALLRSINQTITRTVASPELCFKSSCWYFACILFAYLNYFCTKEISASCSNTSLQCVQMFIYNLTLTVWRISLNIPTLSLKHTQAHWESVLILAWLKEMTTEYWLNEKSLWSCVKNYLIHY